MSLCSFVLTLRKSASRFSNGEARMTDAMPRSDRHAVERRILLGALKTASVGLARGRFASTSILGSSLADVRMWEAGDAKNKR
jgi:hypothetical protein